MAKQQLNEHERITIPEILFVLNIFPPASQRALVNIGSALKLYKEVQSMNWDLDSKTINNALVALCEVLADQRGCKLTELSIRDSTTGQVVYDSKDVKNGATI